MRFLPVCLFVSLAACEVAPTPSMIANCHSSAIVEAPGKASAAVVRFDAEDRFGNCTSCFGLFRIWRLSAVEFPEKEGSALVRRVRPVAKTDPACQASRAEVDRLPWLISAPRGQCLVVERAPSIATVRAAMVIEPAGDHAMELVEATDVASGQRLARVRNFAIRAADAAPAHCGRVLRNFPNDAFRYVLDRAADRR